MTVAGFLAVAKRVPSIAYVVAFVVASIAAVVAAGGYAMYQQGVRHEQRKALAVETPIAEAAVTLATQHSNTVIAVAEKAKVVSDAAKHRSDTARVVRATLRAEARTELLDAGLPKIHALIAHDDAEIAGDSVAMAKLVETNALALAAKDSLLRERTTREHLDTVRVATIAVSQPDHHTTAKIVGGVVAGVLAALTLIHFTR